MSEYLSKEEIKQWRSSLERITLEEYARRLGKTLKCEKQTNDIVDIVLSNSNSRYISDTKSQTTPKQAVVEIAKKAMEKEPSKIQKENKPKETKPSFTFQKPLTEREQKVLDYFLSNPDTIIYAKDLAKILELPTDYVYKYIKNLRAKIVEDVLQNAVKGGYKLKV